MTNTEPRLTGTSLTIAWVRDRAVPFDMRKRFVLVFRCWNWKAGLLSTILRVPIFVVATARNGWEALTLAVVTETFICAISAGCYASIVQVLRNMEPLWLTATLITVALPALAQIVEFRVHQYMGTPHRIPAVIVSTVLSALSALFNWYAMRRGTLLAGPEMTSLGSDLRRIPRLIAAFVLLPYRWGSKLLEKFQGTK